MKTDDEIRKDVELELKWDVDIDSRDIAVAVRDGVVALTSKVEKHFVVSREASSAPRTSAAQPSDLVGSP